MALATTEQALEVLANDTPERYLAEAKKSAGLATALGASGALITQYIGLELWGKLERGNLEEYFMTGVAAAALAGGVYCAGKIATDLFHDALEYRQFAKNAGTGRAYVCTEGNEIRKQVTSREKRWKHIIPYAHIGNIPKELPDDTLAAVNGATIVEYFYSITTPHRFGFATGQSRIRIHPESNRKVATGQYFVLVQPDKGDMHVTRLSDCITVDDYMNGKKRKVKPEARTDLAWTPA